MSDLDQALERANDSIFGPRFLDLEPEIWTPPPAPPKGWRRATPGSTRSPRIYDELPFGGFKQSGLGQEHGIEALACYQQSKSVVVAAG